MYLALEHDPNLKILCTPKSCTVNMFTRTESNSEWDEGFMKVANVVFWIWLLRGQSLSTAEPCPSQLATEDCSCDTDTLGSYRNIPVISKKQEYLINNYSTKLHNLTVMHSQILTQVRLLTDMRLGWTKRGICTIELPQNKTDVGVPGHEVERTDTRQQSHPCTHRPGEEEQPSQFDMKHWK